MRKKIILLITLLFTLLMWSPGAEKAEAAIVYYCGMPTVTAPAANASVSGMMSIYVANDTATSPETPWAIPFGTTVQVWFKIVPAGTSLGDASNGSDPLIHKWGFSDINNIQAQTDVSGYANGNYLLGVRVSYYCATDADHAINYWPTFVDWYKIPITINNAVATRSAEPVDTSASPATQSNTADTPATAPTTTKQAEANQNLEQVISELADKQKMVEALKAAPVSENYIVNQAALDDKAKTIKLSGKVDTKGTVFLYIFSDPLVLSVETDDEGNWEYNLTDPLTPGKHDLYVAMKDETGTIKAKSALMSFVVSTAFAASSESAVTPTVESGIISGLSDSTFYVAVAALIILLALLIALVVRRKKTLIR